MRNRFPGRCYRCGLAVQIGEGHFEAIGSTRRADDPPGKWRMQHATCTRAVREADAEAYRRDSKGG